MGGSVVNGLPDDDAGPEETTGAAVDALFGGVGGRLMGGAETGGNGVRGGVGFEGFSGFPGSPRRSASRTIKPADRPVQAIPQTQALSLVRSAVAWKDANGQPWC